MKEDEFILTVICWQGWEQASKTMVDTASALPYLHNSLYYFHSHNDTCVSVWQDDLQARGTCLACTQKSWRCMRQSSAKDWPARRHKYYSKLASDLPTLVGPALCPELSSKDFPLSPPTKAKSLLILKNKTQSPAGLEHSYDRTESPRAVMMNFPSRLPISPLRLLRTWHNPKLSSTFSQM